MKKRLNHILLLLTVFAFLPCFCVYSEAAGNGATYEEQTYVAQLVNDDPVYGERLREKKETLLTETIAPLFRFDPIEYAQSGVFSLSKIEGYYWVDVVTETGAFAGIATVIIKDGSLKSVFFARSSETAGPDYLGRHSMPCCFENYRQDIERVIGKEITADPVLIVKVNNNRDAYYIDQPEGEYDYFVLHPLDGEKITQDSIFRIDDDFYDWCKQEADEYQAEQEQRRIEREEWEKNHPGATFPAYYGGPGTETKTEPGKNNFPTVTVLICICAVVIIGGALTAIILCAKKRNAPKQ
jgi:hypothetical protein